MLTGCDHSIPSSVNICDVFSLEGRVGRGFVKSQGMRKRKNIKVIEGGFLKITDAVRPVNLLAIDTNS